MLVGFRVVPLQLGGCGILSFLLFAFSGDITYPSTSSPDLRSPGFVVTGDFLSEYTVVGGRLLTLPPCPVTVLGSTVTGRERGGLAVDTLEILAHHHRQVVGDFIESVLDRMDLTNLERNVVGVMLRREVQEELVPGLVAVQALLHAADAETLGKELPEWLEQVSSVMSAEAEFLEVMGRQLDPVGCGSLDEDVGIRPGESEVRRSFDAHLWELAPSVNSPV